MNRIDPLITLVFLVFIEKLLLEFLLPSIFLTMICFFTSFVSVEMYAIIKENKCSIRSPEIS